MCLVESLLFVLYTLTSCLMFNRYCLLLSILYQEIHIVFNNSMAVDRKGRSRICRLGHSELVLDYDAGSITHLPYSRRLQTVAVLSVDDDMNNGIDEERDNDGRFTYTHTKEIDQRSCHFICVYVHLVSF